MKFVRRPLTNFFLVLCVQVSNISECISQIQSHCMYNLFAWFACSGRGDQVISSKSSQYESFISALRSAANVFVCLPSNFSRYACFIWPIENISYIKCEQNLAERNCCLQKRLGVSSCLITMSRCQVVSTLCQVCDT